MEVAATLKYTRLSAQKARLVLDQIRGLPVDKALDLLTFSNKNAEHNDGADVDELKVAGAWANEGPVLKRIRARAKGRAARILKQTSHITVTVSDN